MTTRLGFDRFDGSSDGVSVPNHFRFQFLGPGAELEKKTDIVLGTSTSLGCLGFSTFGMRDPCSIGIYRNINFGQKKKRTFSKDYFESSPAKELPPCLQQQPRQQAVPNCLRSDIQMTTSGPMVLSKPAGANFPGAPSVPKVTLCFPKRKVSSTSPFFSFENFGTGSLSEGFNRAKTPGPSLDCLAMREASPQLMKTFEIQLDPTKDVPTLFVVHNIKEPGWYESLVKDCDKWLKRHRRNLGDVGANHIKIAKLVSYPKYIKLSNIPLLELCDNTFLVIPQFENIVSTLSEEEWSLDKQGNIVPEHAKAQAPSVVYSVGTRIRANYHASEQIKGYSAWYEGVVSRVHQDDGDVSYDIDYDDGDFEEGVEPQHVQLAEDTTSHKESKPKEKEQELNLKRKRAKEMARSVNRAVVFATLVGVGHIHRVCAPVTSCVGLRVERFAFACLSITTTHLEGPRPQ